VIRERPAPLGNDPIHQFGEQGVVGLPAQPLEDRLEVMLGLDLHLDRPALLRLGLHHAEALHPRIGPGLALPDVGFRNAHLPAEADEWERDRHLLHPFAMTVVDEGVDQLVGG